MILAAGLGTRLKPLTNDKPKALVLLNEKPAIEHIIEKLISAGFEKIIINVHHFAEKMIAFLDEKNFFDHRVVISDESNLLLDTGGGIKKAIPLFEPGQPVLVHNVDIITDLNLEKFMDYHVKTGALATLATRNRKTSRSLLVNQKGQLKGWKNFNTNEQKIVSSSEKMDLNPVAFSGVYALSPEFLKNIQEEGVFSIITVFMRLAENHLVNTFNHDESLWLDIGQVEKLRKAELELKKR